MRYYKLLGFNSVILENFTNLKSLLKYLFVIYVYMYMYIKKIRFVNLIMTKFSIKRFLKDKVQKLKILLSRKKKRNVRKLTILL